jgi:ABC-type dipeptide/oligopeptide/nickel transport system ATPase subunit
MHALHIRFQNIRKSYRGKTVLNGISLDLVPQLFVGLRGASGSGKSTLGRIACGLEAPDNAGSPGDGGQVFWDEVPFQGARDLRRGRMPWLPQNAEAALNPLKTVKTLLEEVCLLRRPRTNKTDLQNCVLTALDRVELSADLLGYRPPDLSGGMNQRLLLTRLLLGEPDALVLDELVTGLDASAAAGLVRLVKGIKEERRLSCLLISHEEAVLHFLCDKIYYLKDGKLFEE